MIALHAGRRQIAEVIINTDVQCIIYRYLEKRLSPKIANIINTANVKKIPVKFISISSFSHIYLTAKIIIPKERMNKLVENQYHEDVIVKANPLKYIRAKSSDINSITSSNLMIYLDKVTDPQNLGSILRQCSLVGVSHLIVDEFSRCPLTPTVSSTSGGSLELLDICCTPNPLNFLKELQFHGWKVYSTGLHNQDNQVSIEQLQVGANDKIILVMGSEGSGVDTEICKMSDKIVHIDQTFYLNRPMVFPNTLLDSLNVSVASSILLSSLKIKLNNSRIN